MELLRLKPAAELGAVTDKINMGLAKLRSDLVSI